MRSLLDPARRAYLHTLTVAVVGVLSAVTVISGALAPLIPAAVLAVFDLAVALTHREVLDWPGKISAAIYGVALAAQPIGLVFAWGTDAQWAIALQLLSAILGGGLAAARAPQPGGQTFTGQVVTDRYGY